MHTQTLSPINYIQRANFFKIVLIGIAICIISNNGYAAPVKVIKLKGTHVVDANIYIPVKFWLLNIQFTHQNLVALY
jgi:hypothetical protein